MAEEDVKEIPLNSALVEANKNYESFGKLDDNAIVDFFGRLYGLNVGKKGARTNAGGAILFAVRRMPDEYKWGYTENGQIFNNALAQVDLGLYAQQAKTARDVTNIDKEFDLVSEASANYLTSQGSTAETAVAPTVQTESQQTNLTSSASGDFLVDASLMSEMSAQEFAQTYRDTTLLDLGFDKGLKFGLVGIMAGGDAGGDDGIDVYEASRWLYSLEPEQVGQLQQKLAQAGYFDALGQSYSRVNDSDDPATRMAWDMFLVDVVRSGASANPQDFLNQQIEGYLANRAPAEGFVFNDEATLQSMGNDFARALVGRNLDYSELQSFYKTVRAWERQAALGVTFAQENEQIDVRARAEEYFDRELRVEQGKQIAFDWISKFE